jgi:hypothetical protein
MNAHMDVLTVTALTVAIGVMMDFMKNMIKTITCLVCNAAKDVMIVKILTFAILVKMANM